MSQINIKSISGITSITTPAGVDNVFTVHSNDTTERFRVDQTGNLNIAGIVTVTKDLDVDGHTNLDNVSIAGVTTTTDDINLPNNKKAKFGSFGFQMYQNTSGSNNAIIEQTASGQFLRLKTNGGALSIEADSVNLRNSANSTQTAIFSAGGKTSLYYNSNLKLTTETGGVNIIGVCTATSFVGSGAQLTGIVGGKFGGGATGIQTVGNVGIQTANMTAPDLVGAASSLVGLYIGDGSLLFSNNLSRSGGYYITTGINALNAGPVSLNTTMTLDGTWVIV